MQNAARAALLILLLVACGYRWIAVMPAGSAAVPAVHCLSDGAGIRWIKIRDRAIQWSGVDNVVNETDVANLQRQRLQLRISRWDEHAPVYITAGLDEQPGAARVDDDGNGEVDDRQELGATGSDDAVLTPDDSQYEQAQKGTIAAVVLSRGAMRRAEGDSLIEAPTQVRIDCIADQQQLTSRIIDLDAGQ